MPPRRRASLHLAPPANNAARATFFEDESLVELGISRADYDNAVWRAKEENAAVLSGIASRAAAKEVEFVKRERAKVIEAERLAAAAATKRAAAERKRKKVEQVEQQFGGLLTIPHSASAPKPRKTQFEQSPEPENVKDVVSEANEDLAAERIDQEQYDKILNAVQAAQRAGYSIVSRDYEAAIKHNKKPVVVRTPLPQNATKAERLAVIAQLQAEADALPDEPAPKRVRAKSTEKGPAAAAAALPPPLVIATAAEQEAEFEKELATIEATRGRQGKEPLSDDQRNRLRARTDLAATDKKRAKAGAQGREGFGGSALGNLAGSIRPALYSILEREA